MAAQKLADLLDGTQYPFIENAEPEFISLAAQNGLVIVYGYGDDTIHFAGASTGHTYTMGGEIVHYAEQGIVDPDACKEKYISIKTDWDDDGYQWNFSTDTDHAVFDVLDGDVKYCRGIVFHISSLIGSEG